MRSKEIKGFPFLLSNVDEKEGDKYEKSVLNVIMDFLLHRMKESVRDIRQN